MRCSVGLVFCMPGWMYHHVLVEKTQDYASRDTTARVEWSGNGGAGPRGARWKLKSQWTRLGLREIAEEKPGSNGWFREGGDEGLGDCLTTGDQVEEEEGAVG